MPNEKAKVVLEMQDKASKSIKKVDTSWGKLIGAIAGGTIVAGAATKALGYLGKGVGELVVATKVAARIEVLNRVFKMTGENAGYTSAQLETTKGKIMALGIAEQEALQIGMRFIQSQLDLADATKIARAAQDLAVIANSNSSETALELTNAIVKQQPRLLKQYGIIADLNTIYGAQAKLLGKTTDELTKNEKRQAFLNEILKQSKTVAGSYEAAMKDVGKQLTSLPRYYQQAQNAVGQHFLPVMRLAVGSAKEFLNAVEAAFSPNVTMLIKATNKLDEQRTKFAEVSKRVVELRDEYANLTNVTEPSVEQQTRMTEILKELEKAMPGAVLAIDNQTTAMRSNLDVLDDLVERRQEQQQQKETEHLAAVSDEYRKLDAQLKGYAHSLDLAKTGVFYFTTANDEQQESIRQSHSAMSSMGFMLGTWRDQLTTIPEAIKQVTTRHDSLLLAMSNMFPELEKNTDAQGLLNESVVQAIITFQAEQVILEARNAKLREQSEVIEVNISAMDRFMGATQKFAEESEKQWEATHEGLQSLPEDYDMVIAGNALMAAAEADSADAAIKAVKKKTKAGVGGYKAILTAHAASVAARRAKEKQLTEEAEYLTGQMVSSMTNTLMSGKATFRDIFSDIGSDFIQYFIQKALMAVTNMFIPGLTSVLGAIFDTPSNDRMAATQGEHFVNWFTAGARNKLADFPSIFAGLVPGGQGTAAAPSLAAGDGPGDIGGGIVINNPIMDSAFVTDTLEPLLVSNAAAGMSDIVINQDNLTGYDDATII